MRGWILAALLPLASGTAAAGTPLPDAPHVVVTGEGEVRIAPDHVIVTMEARHRAGDPAAAKRVVDDAVNGVLRIASDFDIGPDDVAASDLHLREEIRYDDDDRRLPPTHNASREVKVRIDDLDRLGRYMDAALAAGMTGIKDVDFRSAHEAALRKKAREQAVAEATEKAADLASAFGGTLGRVYSINSVTSSLARGYGAELDRIVVTGSRIEDPRYLQPFIEFTEHVSAVFEITPGATP